MISIFSSLKLTSLPWDPISTIRYEVFSRMDPNRIIYWTDVEDTTKCKGAIRRIPCKFKNKYLRFVERIYWMKKIKPDIILLICAPLDFLFYFLKPGNSKVIIHLNGFPPPKKFSSDNFLFYYLNLFLTKFLLKRADIIITVSHFVKDQISSFLSNKKIYVIHNGVDIDFFNPKNKNKALLFEKYKIPPHMPLVSYIGFLIKSKRPQLVIEMAKRMSDVYFVMVGRKNSSSKNLFREIKNLPNLLWIPYMERKEIAVLLASSDILIAPFLYEGFGLVILEAQASGCLVVASNHGALSEIIKNKVNGILISGIGEKDEIKNFVEAIRILQDNKEKEKLIKNGLQNCKINFNWDIISKRWYDVIEQVIVNET